MDLMIKIANKYAQASFSETVYHGTFWSKGEQPHVEPELGYGELGAIYFSQGEDTGEYFSDWHAGAEDTRVVFRGELKLADPVEYTGRPGQQSHYFELDDGQEFDIVRDREELYKALSDNGHDAFIIRDNYPDGDDIAVFDNDKFRTEEIKIKFPGEDWTDWLEPEAAVELWEKETAK